MRTEKQRPGETPDISGREPDPSAEAARRELCLILDQELARLPAKYRSPLVLHYLEGKTKEETARELGWTEGTVSGRLDRARESLRKRLAGRNVSFSSGMMAALLSEQAATAPVPAALTSATMQSALLLGTSSVAGAAATGASHTLAEAVLKSMVMSKLKHVIPLAIVLLAAIVGVAVGGQRIVPYLPKLTPVKPEGPEVVLPNQEPEPPKPPDEGLSQEELDRRFGSERDAKRFAGGADLSRMLSGPYNGEIYDDLDHNRGKIFQAQLDTKTGHWTVKWASKDFRIIDRRARRVDVRERVCTAVVCYKPDQGWKLVSIEQPPFGWDEK
jgi:hypothetical protein